VRKNLIQKFSEEEMGLNSDLLNDFSHAFSSYDINAILDLLHDHGRFFKGLNKGKAAGVFHKMIHGPKGVKSRNSFKYNRGISLDISPGRRCSRSGVTMRVLMMILVLILRVFMDPNSGSP